MTRGFSESGASVALIVRHWNSIERLKSLWGDFKTANANSIVNFKFYIFDDASNDGSQLKLRQEFPEARILVSRKRIEYAASLNRAACAAREEGAHYLFFCNADCDGFSKNFLELMVSEVELNKLDWVSPTVFDFSGKNLSDLRRKFHFEVPFNVQTEAHLIKSNVFIRLGGFNENLVRYGEDVELMNRFLSAGLKSGTSQNASLRHEGSGLSSRQIFVRTHFIIRNAFLLQSHLRPRRNTDTQRWIKGVFTSSHLKAARPVWYAAFLWGLGVATGFISGLLASRSQGVFLSTKFIGSPATRFFLLGLDFPLEKFATAKRLQKLI